MTRTQVSRIAAAALLVCLGLPAGAQGTTAPATAPATEDAGAATEDSLKIYFGSGSAYIAPAEVGKLETAARLYREGSPIVMVVAGGADTVGDAQRNLGLSIRRAQTVADALVARGIPVERLQVLGRGNSELEVPTDPGVNIQENRVVEITWR